MRNLINRNAINAYSAFRGQRRLILVLLICVIGSILLTKTAGTQSPPPGIKTDRQVYPEPPLPTLPAAGGKFIDPVFGTEIMRATDASDDIAAGSPGNGTFYSHWPTFNCNNTKILFRNGIEGNASIKSFDPVNFTVTPFIRQLPQLPDSNHSSASWEGATWSNTDPNIIYVHPLSYDGGRKIFTFNVATGQFNLYADLDALLPGAGTRYLKQMYMSQDEDVFSFLHKTSTDDEPIGYLVYRHSTNSIVRNIANTNNVDEAHVDKSGKWVHVPLGGVMPGTEYNTQILNVATGGIENLSRVSPDFAPGHGDLGTETIVAFNNDANSISIRNLATPHSPTDVFYWRTGLGPTGGVGDFTQDFHGSMLADDESWITVGTYDDPAVTDPDSGVFEDEIIQIALDGSERLRRICHTRSYFDRLTNTTDYWANPKPTISKDGRFIAFTSNWENSGRYDLFIAKIDPAPSLSIPAPPTGLSFVFGDDDPKLMWKEKSNNETGFRIERKPIPIFDTGSPWSLYATVGANTSTYTLPDPDAVSYQYRVRAFNANGESAPSNAAHCHCWSVDNDIDIAWTNIVNATASGNGLTATADNARGETTQAITSGNGSIISTVALNDSSPGIIRIGLINGAFMGDATEIDYGWKYWGNGVAYPCINNVAQTNYIETANGDTLEVRINGTTIEWYHNQTPVHTATAALTYPYRGVAQITASGDSVTNVRMTGVSASFWTNIFNANASGSNLTATADNARAETTQAVTSGNGSVKSTIMLNSSSPGIVRIGFINGAFTGDPTELDYHWKYWENGVAYPCINNVAQANYTEIADGDTLEVRINGTTVEWYHNNTIVHYASSQSLTYPYRGVAQITASGDVVTNVMLTGAQ